MKGPQMQKGAINAVARVSYNLATGVLSTVGNSIISRTEERTVMQINP